MCLATAPHSNVLYEAYSRVQEDVQKTGNEHVPLHIRSASTQLITDLNHGKDYKYTHNYYTMQLQVHASYQIKRFLHTP
jgi:putative ATPase